MTERILWQTGEAHGLCNGVSHVLVTNDGQEWKQGGCDCPEGAYLRPEASSIDNLPKKGI